MICGMLQEKVEKAQLKLDNAFKSVAEKRQEITNASGTVKTLLRKLGTEEVQANKEIQDRPSKKAQPSPFQDREATPNPKAPAPAPGPAPAPVPAPAPAPTKKAPAPAPAPAPVAKKAALKRAALEKEAAKKAATEEATTHNEVLRFFGVQPKADEQLLELLD